MILEKSIKENIANAIKRSGMSQTQIAKELSVSQSCVAHYVRGDILPALDTFANLCVLLRENPSDILGITAEP